MQILFGGVDSGAYSMQENTELKKWLGLLGFFICRIDTPVSAEKQTESMKAPSRPRQFVQVRASLADTKTRGNVTEARQREPAGLCFSATWAQKLFDFTRQPR